MSSAQETVEETPAVVASQSSWRCVQSGDREGWLALMADDILVEGKRKPDQFIWPVILVGRDRLDRCREIVFQRDPLRLTLHCAPPLAPAAEAPHP